MIGAVGWILLNGHPTFGGITACILESKRAQRTLPEIFGPIVRWIQRMIHTDDIDPATAFVGQTCVRLETGMKKKSTGGMDRVRIAWKKAQEPNTNDCLLHNVTLLELKTQH
jgi:hypothetical protein